MTDTTGSELLKAILASPDDDNVRLVYADWLQEYGEEERAEFVRVQCELARVDNLRVARRRVPGGSAKTRAALVRRERELLASVARGFLGDVLDWHTHCRVVGENAVQYDSAPGTKRPQVGSIIVQSSRGFVSSVTCTAIDWFAHADGLVWHPGQTDRCFRSCDHGRTGRYDSLHQPIKCMTCNGTGRVPRPCPRTAQPITHVTLTTLPSPADVRAAGGVTHDGTDWPPARFLANRWPGVTFHATSDTTLPTDSDVYEQLRREVIRGLQARSHVIYPPT